MKLSTKLALSFVGVVGVLSIAGCPGGIPGFGNPQTAPSAAAPGASTLPRLIISRVVISNAPHQGEHEVYLKNLTSADIPLNTYRLYYAPGNTVSVASSTIAVPGVTNPTVKAGETVRVFMFTGADNVATDSQAVAAGLNGQVQYGTGGGVALFDSLTATASGNLKDFVQFGKKGTYFEAVAQSANLWQAGTAVATTSLAGFGGVINSVVTEGATGSTNWTFNTF